MIANSKAIWITTGYEIFALNGQSALKIQPLAKKVGKSKSSFYHHFADLELFIDNLLHHHIEKSKIIALKEQNATRLDPDVIDIFLEHKIDLLFNRQLRISQNVKPFALTLDQSNKIVGNSFVNVLAIDLGFQLSQQQIEGIFTLALENFFLQINVETLNREWLSNYFKNIKKIAKSFT